MRPQQSQQSWSSARPGNAWSANASQKGGGWSAAKPTPATPAGIRPAEAAGARKGTETPALTVSSQSKRTDIGIPTLCGDYVEMGINHQKKYYQKAQKIAGHEDVKVFLYFWDTRDGPDFSGWWFGDKLGGSQVWARCATQSQQPPRAGWKLPWDAPKAELGLLFVDPYKGLPASKQQTPSGAGAAAGGAPAPTSMAIKPQTGISPAASAGISKFAKPGELAKKESNALQTEVKAADGAAMALKKQKQEEENQKELKGQLQQVGETVNGAEDVVEACTILAQPFMENPNEAQGADFNNACEEIEKTAQDAQSKINEARRELNAKVQAAKRFAPETRKSAIDQFTKLQSKLTECQKKLAPYKSFKKELAQRVEAKKALDEIVDKLSAAEVEVEKVALMVAPSEGAQIEEAEINAAEEAIKPAQMQLQAATRGIEIKLQKVDGSGKDDLIKLKDRAAESKKKLESSIVLIKKNKEGVATTSMLDTAKEKVDKIDQALARCSEAEMPFLTGIEVLPGEDSAKAISEMEAAANACHVACTQAKSYLLTKTNEAKRYTSKELSKEVLEKLAELTKRMEEGSTRLTGIRKETSERKTAAVPAMVDDLEKKFKAATELCAPLLEGGGEKFLVASSISTLGSVLKEYLTEKKLSIEDLFKQVNSGKAVDKESFKLHLTKLPETISRDELTFTEERCAAMAEAADADGDGEINLADFKLLFQQKLRCVKKVTVTDAYDVAASKTVAKLEVDDIVEAVGEKKTDETSGITRMECKTASGETGWVTVTGNSGTKFLEEGSPLGDFMKEVDATIAATVDTAKKVTVFISAKIAEIGKVAAEGAVADSKKKIVELRPRVVTVEKSCNELKQKLTSAKAIVDKKVQQEISAHIEVREKKAADTLMTRVRESLENVESLRKQLEEAAKPAAKGLLDTFETPLSLAEECEKLSAELIAAVADAKAKIKEPQAQLSNKGPMLEAKRELAKMQVKVQAASTERDAKMKAVQKACGEIVEARYLQASVGLRQELQKAGITREAFFLQLSGGADRIPSEKFIKKLEGLGIKGEQAKLLTERLDIGGIGRRRFMSLVEQYYVVLKDIAITTDFEVQKCKTLRKVEAEEVIEVLEGPREDEKTKLQRVRGRSLRDATEGWITLKGNAGTAYLQEVEKPYYAMNSEVKLESDFTSSAELIRSLAADEIFELLEGPKKESFNDATRARGKSSDGRTGWITCVDHKGVVFAEKAAHYFKCVAGVAITDDLKIRDCKVLRKLLVGEIFLADAEPLKDEDAGILRVQGTAMKDGQKGWVTVTGNAGSVYLEPSQKHWKIVKEVSLQSGFASTSEKQGEPLKESEAFEVLEGPRTEKFATVSRVRGKTLKDGAIGWITLSNTNVRAWAPYYKCLAATPILAEKSKESEVVRQLEVDENVEYLEGPEVDPDSESKSQRIKARANKDGATGWILVKEAGKVYLENQL
mmetsp:Transcript_22762/g.51950  ORF Transcript_22762/g.51950 Transcript_22762/m.51950 type:complete len:1457 (+) Transcript_22762:68-4438(+)